MPSLVVLDHQTHNRFLRTADRIYEPYLDSPVVPGDYHLSARLLVDYESKLTVQPPMSELDRKGESRCRRNHNVIVIVAFERLFTLEGPHRHRSQIQTHSEENQGLLETYHRQDLRQL